MTGETLLAVDKMEVVYQRAITAVQGITMQVREELDPGNCGPFADSFAYAYEAVGLIPFDGPTYEIICPPEEGLR